MEKMSVILKKKFQYWENNNIKKKMFTSEKTFTIEKTIDNIRKISITLK